MSTLAGIVTCDRKGENPNKKFVKNWFGGEGRETVWSNKLFIKDSHNQTTHHNVVVMVPQSAKMRIFCKNPHHCRKLTRESKIITF